MPEAIETAYVAIRPDTRGFAQETRRQVKRSVAPQRDLVPRIGIRGKLLPGLVGLGTTLTGVTAGAVGLTLALRAGFNEFTEGQKVLAQTNATIKSTGGVAGVSADEVSGLANSLNSLSGVDDEVIQQGENLLLTFKNVRNVVGEGNDIFNRATRAALDLSVKGFGSVSATSKQMGKALNDPIKGMSALSRAGVTFSGAQKQAIKAMVENNNVLGAQKLILKEVESQVGGSAEAYGQTLPGALGRLSNSFNELIASGIAKVGPSLASGANDLANFFDELKSGGGAGAGLKATLDAVLAGVKPLINAIKSEGPRIRDILTTWFEAFRKSLPILKVVAIVIGVTIVAAFKVSIRIMQLMVHVIAEVNAMFRKAAQIIVGAIEHILGAMSGLARAASHLPFVGDKFDGVAEAIDTARETLRNFNDELDGTNGKEVNVTVNVETKHGGVVIPKGADAPTADLGTPDGKGTGGVEKPGPTGSSRRLNFQNTLTLARSTPQTLSDDRRALADLIAFYKESVRLAKERGVGAKVYQAAVNEAQNELNQINADATQAAKDAAEQTKSDAAAHLAAVDAERRANLEANIQLAAGTKFTLRDDKIAYRKLIAYLKERVAVAKAAHAGVKAALAELAAARGALRDLLRDAAQKRIDERETLLQGAVTLASFTERRSDDEKALRRLIAFYRKRVKDEKLTRVERQKYRIELARTKKDLADLRDEQSDTAKEGASFGRLSVDFLQNLQGFSSTLASNINPRGFNAGLTEALVSSRSKAVAATSTAQEGDFFGPPLGTGKGPDGGPVIAPKGKNAGAAALEHREKAQGPATAAQFERLLSIAQQTNRILRRIAQEQQHPEAKFNKKQSSAAVVVGVS